MRLFIALTFEDPFIEQIVSLQNSLRNAGATGNYTKRENLHMTLAFIGEYGNPDEILDVMEEVPLKPMTIRLQGLQHFRDMYFARISDNPRLEGYVRKLRRALAENDFPFDRKKFSPHITLIRRVSYLNGVPAIEDIPSAVTNATRVSLMRSERGKNGMIYTPIGCVEAEGA